MKIPANLKTTRFGFMVHKLSLEECIEYAIENDINHLELDLKKENLLLKTFTSQRITAITKQCRQADITLSLHPPFNKNLCSKIPLVRMACVSYLKKTIDLASHLGALHITLHLGNFYRFAAWANPRDNALERLYNVLDKLLPYCQHRNMVLALENMVPIPADAGYSFLGDNVEDFHKIFQRFDSDYIKFCLDIGHANAAEGPMTYVDALINKMVSCHFHDNLGNYDDHMNVGEGTVPWPELIKELKEKSFNGPYVSECFSVKPHKAIKTLKNMTHLGC